MSFIQRQLELFIKDKREMEQKTRNRFALIPYFYEISHNLKACARQFGVETVIRSDFRISKLMPFHTGLSECKKSQREKSICCGNGVVYEMPLKCGFKYVGQTSRCINERLKERKINGKRNEQNTEIAKHIHGCNNCTVQWSETEIAHKGRNDVKRSLRETAYMIAG